MPWQHHLFIFNRREGALAGDLAGAAIFQPPKRPHRMRRRETLLIYLHQQGNAPLGNSEQRALLEKLSERYFSVGGSVTAALKELATALNTYFLNRNRKLSNEGKHAIGWLGMAVWRSGTVYVALSGPMHAVFLGEETRHYHDPEMSGRGLGISRAARVYFATAPFREGDALLLTPQLPAPWQNTLQLDASRKISPLIRRMSAYRGETLEGVLVQVRGGEGEVRRRVVSEKPQSTATAAAKPAPPVAAAEGKTASQPPAPPQEEAAPPKRPAAPPARPVASPRPSPQRRPASAPQAAKPVPAAVEKEAPKAAAPPRSKKSTAAVAAGVAKLRSGLASAWRSGERVAETVRNIAGRGLSASADEVFSLPRSFMAFSAIAVPLIVVTVAVIVFVRRGSMQQFEAYLNRAKVEAAQALQIDEPLTRHNALVAALDDLQAAEKYYSNDESRTLRAQLTAALDELDGARRLDFVPVSDRLPPGTVAQRLLVQGADLYVLDAATGAVYHLELKGQRYALDKDFHCGAGTYGELEIAPLVDIALLPEPRSRYKVVGVDVRAHGVLCAPGEAAQAFTLAPATPANWQRPTAIGYQTGDLYVLDPVIKAVEVIGMSAEGVFEVTPYNYFVNGAPQGVETAIDMAVQRGGLYLLYQDGQVMHCKDNSSGAVTCDAMPYNDTRPGRTPGPVIPNTRFTQVRLQPPPDPSLYMLDAVEGAIYRFSLQLQFVTQYRPRTALEGDITAFAIDSDTHTLYVVAGRRIYQAPLE